MYKPQTEAAFWGHYLNLNRKTDLFKNVPFEKRNFSAFYCIPTLNIRHYSEINGSCLMLIEITITWKSLFIVIYQSFKQHKTYKKNTTFDRSMEFHKGMLSWGRGRRWALWLCFKLGKSIVTNCDKVISSHSQTG